ncbi:MAG: hypothetical protein H0W77_08725 [Acidobacteria bacterium]|nr:hypothetical protein [Acidobacteriota bacterium]
MTVGDFNRDTKVDLAVRCNTLTAGANNFSILPRVAMPAAAPIFSLCFSNCPCKIDIKVRIRLQPNPLKLLIRRL